MIKVKQKQGKVFSSSRVMSQTIEKQLVFSILQYLSSVSQSQREDIDVESLEVAIQCLGTAFALDVNDEAQKEEFATETSLKEIFKYGLVLDKSENTPLGNMLKQVIKTSEVCGQNLITSPHV